MRTINKRSGVWWPHPAIACRAPSYALEIYLRGVTDHDISRWRTSATLGDYVSAGLEDVCVVERKDLADLVHSLTTDRSLFISWLRRMAGYPHRLLVIAAALSQVKSPYTFSAVDPNRIVQSLIAVLAGTGAPSLHRDPRVGRGSRGLVSVQVHLYHWLEANDYGRFLADNDL